MNFHRKKGFALSLAIALAYGSTAFAATVPAGVQLNAKQELVRNNGSEPETLDPHVMTGVPEHRLASCIFEGLVGQHPEIMERARAARQSGSTRFCSNCVSSAEV